MANKLSKKDIDLLSAYKQKKEPSKYTGAVKYAIFPIGMLIIVGGLMIYFTLSNNKLQRETKELKEQTVKIQEQIANDPNLERYNSLQTVKRDIAAYKKFKKDIQSYPELSQNTFDKIVLASDVDVTVTNFSYTRESQIVTLQIEGTSVDSAERFVRRLKNTELFAAVDYTGYSLSEKTIDSAPTTDTNKNQATYKDTNTDADKNTTGTSKSDNASETEALLKLLNGLNQTNTQKDTATQKQDTQKVYTATILCTLK